MYKLFYNDLGKVDSINRQFDGASLPFDSATKTFDESHPLVIELREWEQKNGQLDLRSRVASLPDLASAKLQVQQQIIDLASAKQEALTAGYSDTERDTWDRKEQEAQNYLKLRNLADAKYLKAEAQAMAGTDNASTVAAVTEQLALAVISKADQLRFASAVISGTRARKWQEVEALTDITKILNYPVEEGWPP